MCNRHHNYSATSIRPAQSLNFICAMHTRPGKPGHFSDSQSNLSTILHFDRIITQVQRLKTMKIILTKVGSGDTHFCKSQVKRLLSWLGGVDTPGLGFTEKLISRNLPNGITIDQSTAEELGHACKEVIESHGHQAEAIVKFVFSSLRSHDDAKSEAVIRSVISVIAAESVPKFVRIAVRARPSLALTVSKTATMLLPEETARIASAVESVVTTVS
jgi:hypothetical protein